MYEQCSADEIDGDHGDQYALWMIEKLLYLRFAFSGELLIGCY